MCEWLGCARAYTDVRLVVGGRALHAHRAVLASASPFLKGILLSCPIEESPTIVLPDYDFEAMSSILYYIYNGEVTIEKHKIEMCLDIIKSMQIYVDCEYLPHTYKLEINVNKIHDMEDVFQLDLNSKNPQKYVKFRKGIPPEELLKCSITNVYNVLDKSQGIAETKTHNMSVYENVHFKDRQRNSFLRDVFKETYPRNGKLNGQTSSVRAISNERYHGATSMLSSNANNKHLNTEDAAAQPSHQKPHGISYLSMETESHQVQYQYTHNQINGSTHPLQMNNNDELASNFATLINTTRYVNESSNVHQIRNRLRHEYFRPKIANESTIGSSEKYSSSNDNIIEKKLLHQLKLPRRPILNQVLDNPWSARKPANFIPIHKHDISCDQKRIEGTGVKEHDKSAENDSNNNVSPEVNDVINEPKDFTITPDSDSSKCSKCDQIFPTTESLSEHARCHTGRYTCPDCGKNFSQLRNFKYHMSVHRGTKEFAATCPVCGKYFNDRGYLSSHMKIHRNRKEYKCSMCPKSFNQRVAYNMHVRIHTGVKPHVCNECGKAFSRKMLLKQHQRTHSGERPYACPHCDKRFADRSNMTLHLRLHTGVKPFSCTLCPKSFTKKHHLKSHLNYHTGAKPYACSRCNLAFTQSSNMRTHMKKCTATPSSE